MKNEKGSALILVTFTMIIIFLLGTALLDLSFGDFTIAHNQVDQVKAYYIAEAGIEKALVNVEIDDIKEQSVGYSVDLDVGENPFAEGKFDHVRLTLMDKGPQQVTVKLKSTGYCNGAKKDILVKAKFSLGNVEIEPYSSFIATEDIMVKEHFSITGNAYIPGEDMDNDALNISGEKFPSDEIMLPDNESITNEYYQKAFNEGSDHILHNTIIDTIVLDGLEEGGIYFIEGATQNFNLEIKGNYRKNITIFVDGDITITDDLTSDDKNNHMLNILTNGNLIITRGKKDEESFVDAFLFVLGEVDIKNKINVNGGVICGNLKTTSFGSITIHPTISYHPEIELITSEDGEGIDIEYWREGTDIL